ncbi:MAG: hypothetical protein ABII22_04130 [Candidatus Micrarchaeota archaeon]
MTDDDKLDELAEDFKEESEDYEAEKKEKIEKAKEKILQSRKTKDLEEPETVEVQKNSKTGMWFVVAIIVFLIILGAAYIAVNQGMFGPATPVHVNQTNTTIVQPPVNDSVVPANNVPPPLPDEFFGQ